MPRSGALGGKKMTFTVIFVLLSVACGKQTASGYDYTHRLQVNNQILRVEIANTPEAMTKGLADRNSLGDDEGMLFDFGSNSSTTPAFWMKGMKFNLDLIWIKDKKIVGITANVPAPDVNCQSSIVNCLPSYSPPSPINWVLEVNAGWVEKNNIKVGDKVIEQD